MHPSFWFPRDEEEKTQVHKPNPGHPAKFEKRKSGNEGTDPEERPRNKTAEDARFVARFSPDFPIAAEPPLR